MGIETKSIKYLLGTKVSNNTKVNFETYIAWT